MKTRYTIFLFFLTINAFAHPLHLSLSNMDISEDSIHFSIKIFEDDFTDALTQRGLEEINFTPINSSSTIAILSYLKEFFVIQINGETINYTLNSIETKELAVWTHLSFALNEPIEKLNIQNRVMLDWFNDQKNLLIVNYKGTEQGYQYDNRTTELEIPIKK